MKYLFELYLNSLQKDQYHFGPSTTYVYDIHIKFSIVWIQYDTPKVVTTAMFAHITLLNITWKDKVQVNLSFID